ncbi:hypothetical protein CANTEDRAFT_114906 [Yamadazyma tenuis ATCC 10573]|uniref:CCA tRNA nucleotidyltransferase, mitochondrial n=2 Tax=Candida tenuis TaxID=2315449 RepID=G3BAL1_CANTC|nr:uncharacterized protein CANTEDRAFT_114906 [Yamadazyma tenuis ATCC 10573]XP_006688695.1 uncharacterized protein CANTEDRAFT_114906 [Yamadazyma tenuis ATCC 10573]EGV62524.1 hypothetical protein CANTEDRAFT_114906 [Yamadazyma tenuis ATCC 10573]EGV62525.1 hypothetical protein CANTEDRAFT_114906 [Yamadazyma tenuis ATCC 10573]
MKRTINNSIVLNETEVNIKNLLLEFCNQYNSTIQDRTRHLVLRITGGWVRDKLLGDESHDLDVAINHMSGEEFASKLSLYLTKHHPDLPLSSVYKIKSNPEKSKHLETCTTKIYDLDIDFVNLRSEKYTSESRIPVIEYGTAQEDALRRDATLNALFYNLNESKIEDFTNRGLQDLQDGILRTPLKPLQTFLDDPLRVLRLVRFASRYNFTVETETLTAMKDPEINASLLHKISRERVGVELDKILTSANPEYGLRLLNYVNITESVFNVGTISSQLSKFNSTNEIEQYGRLSQQLGPQVSAATAVFPVFKSILLGSDNHRLIGSFNTVSSKHLWLSVVLYPFRSMSLRINDKMSGIYHVPEIIIKEGLRFGKHDFEPVSNVLANLGSSSEIWANTVAGTIARSRLGLYLRQFGIYGDVNILVNCFLEALQQVQHLLKPSHDEPTPQPPVLNDPDINDALTATISKYERILGAIEEQDLTLVHSLKPLVDGKTISKALDKKSGPWMAPVIQEVLVWQLDNPQGTPEQCLEHLKRSL